MKGIIFNVVEEVVRAEHGEQAWDSILERAGASGAYTSLGTYPDSELLAIAGSAAAQMGVTPEEVVRAVGVAGIPMFAQRYPHFFTEQPNLLEFLLSLNEIIHPEVRKLYPGAIVPVFTFAPPVQGPGGATVLQMGYRSQRAMCSLAEGLILGASRWFTEPIDLAQTHCVHRGDPQCVLVLTWKAGHGQ